MDNDQFATKLDPKFPIRNLVGFLDSLLVRLPQTQEEAKQRRESINLACEGLNELGLDAESLVRYSMSNHVGVSLISAILIEPIETNAHSAPPVDTVRWREILQIPTRFGSNEAAEDEGLPSAEARSRFLEEYQRIRPRIRRWVEYAPFADLIDLNPPTEESLAEITLEAEPDAEVVAAYVWILERATQPQNVEHWSNASLVAEFKWLEGEGGAPFGETILREQGAVPTALHYEIAKRTANPPESDTDQYDPLLWQIQEQAQTLLRQLRYAEASALFEFYYRLHPESKQALNNLAFCKLPIDPSSSLHHLKRAEKAGFTPLIINIYNQCCCLVMLSREGEALDRAEHYWQRQRVPEKIGGYLWRQTDEEKLEFYSEPDAQLALARLAQQVAQTLDLSERVDRWRARAEEIEMVWTAVASTSSESVPTERGESE